MQLGVRAGPPDGHHHQIARLHSGDLRPGLNNFGERFVAEDQIIVAIGRRAVFERNDLAIGSAYADFEHLHLGLGGRDDPRLWMVDDAYFMFAWKDGDGFH